MCGTCAIGRPVVAARLALAAWLALFNISIHGLHTCRLPLSFLAERRGECFSVGHSARESIVPPSHVAGWAASGSECAACHYLLGCPQAIGFSGPLVLPDDVRPERLAACPTAQLPSAQYSPSSPRAPPSA